MQPISERLIFNFSKEPALETPCGGKVVGNIDLGYGPARVFTAEDVSKIYDVLKHIDLFFR